jgi:hypothetical protein
LGSNDWVIAPPRRSSSAKRGLENYVLNKGTYCNIR